MNKYKKFIYIFPLTLWLIIFFILPMIMILSFSFLERATYGGVNFIFSLRTFSVFKDKIFLLVLGKTVYLSVIITFFTVLLAIPTAYYISRSKHKDKLLLLIIIPFWTNFLVRMFSWIGLLGSNGFINSFLLNIGIISSPIKMLYTPLAVIIISIYTNLPFAILPLYAVVEKFDYSLMEAARDLGATNAQSFFKIFIPNIKSGIFTSVLFTFIPALGSYAVPQFVGGTNVLMLGNLIAQHIKITRDWPLAATISLALILLTSLTIFLFIKLDRKKVEDANG